MPWVGFGFLFFLCLFFFCWGHYSRKQLHSRIPSDNILGPYADDLFKKVGLDPHLRETIQTDTLISHGILLHLDILKGKPGDPVVVFVPGTAVYALTYVEFMIKLSRRGYHVIGFDPRGHGRSQGLRGSYTVEELVQDTQAVIRYARERCGPDVFLAGSSQGGIVAFYTAANDKELKGAICHNLADLTDPDTLCLTRFPALARLGKPLLRLARILPEFQIPISFYLDLKKEETRLFGNAQEFLNQDPLALRSISFKAFASLASTPLPCPVEAVTTPVMILHAEKDSIFPLDYIEKIYRRLPGPKRLHLAKGQPHLLLTDFVEEMVPPVSDWMQEMLARKPSG